MTLMIADASSFIARQLSYVFEDRALLIEALVATGFGVNGSNQRLAMLGDAVLQHIIMDDWYGTGASKGEGSRLVSTIGSNTRLANAACGIRLGHHIITNPGHVGPVSSKMLATCVEAIIGAVYLDSGKDMSVVKDTMTAFGLHKTG